MPRMRPTALLTACLLLLSARPGVAQAADPAAAERPSYQLQARLDPSAGRVHGHVHIRWLNRSRAPVRELFLHLYPNAFENAGTVFMREGGRSLRSSTLERRGGIELRSLELTAGGVRSDLLPRAERELVPGDRSQLRVALPVPLAPGAALELDVVFDVQLPSLVARMGQAGDFFMIAQWYPKLATHEPDGRWVSFPYHGLGEFYADFADHEIELEVPRDYVIAAPGSLLEARETQTGTRIERYALNDALDVAWAAYPRFRRERLRAGNVELEAFAPPGHTALARSQLALVRDGLERLGAHLGRYPYARLVLVLPPGNAYGASGMEYPGLIVGATASWHSELDAISTIVHDATTTHELAHQWFPLLIASNELQAPVLDEGLAQWLGMDLLRERYGRDAFWQRLVGLPADPFELLRAGFARGPAPPSSLLPAWRYRSRELGPAIYARPALALETLRRSYGAPRLWTALAHYAQNQRHQHPRLQDLLTAFDQSYWPNFSRTLLSPLLSGTPTDARLHIGARHGGARHGDGPAILQSGLGGQDAGDCPTQVLAERTGELALPSSLLLLARDGSEQRQPWPPTARTVAARCDPERTGAAIDDLRANLLDRAVGDDQARLSASAPQLPWLARLLYWAQLVLTAVGA